MHHYFQKCGYTNYQLLGNGGIQPTYLVHSVLLCYILGTTSRPVGVAYHLYMLVYVYLPFFLMPLIFIFCMELRMVWRILIPICIVRGWDWPGVWHWRIYMYWLIVSCFGAKSLYVDEVAGCPSNRWTLSVFL